MEAIHLKFHLPMISWRKLSLRKQFGWPGLSFATHRDRPPRCRRDLGWFVTLGSLECETSAAHIKDKKVIVEFLFKTFSLKDALE